MPLVELQLSYASHITDTESPLETPRGEESWGQNFEFYHKFPRNGGPHFRIV